MFFLCVVIWVIVNNGKGLTGKVLLRTPRLPGQMSLEA